MTKPVGIEKLTPDNIALYQRLTHLLRLKWSWQAICDDVGIYHVDDLCCWYAAFKSPKPDVFRNGGMIHSVPVKVRHGMTKEQQAEKFLAWRRQNEGAKRTLEAMRK